MMVVTSAVEVPLVIPAPLAVAVLLAEVPDVSAGVIVTVMAGKLPPEATAEVLVQVTVVVVELPQLQPEPVRFDCVRPDGSESLRVTVWPPVDPGPVLLTVIV